MYLLPVAKHVDTIVVGAFEVNCYLVWDEISRDLIIIDPGDEAAAVIQRVDAIGAKPRAILLTHGHGDHIGAVTEIRKKLGIPLVAGANEKQYLADPRYNLSGQIGLPISLAPAEQWVEDEDIITFGSLSFRVLSTPGHTSGGVCFLDEDGGAVFCGDTIFQGSIGRTDFPGSSLNELMLSIQNKILTLPDDSMCYPGHGPITTVGVERRSNPFILEHLYG